MNNSISINGMAVVTIDENSRVSNIQFLPDDEFKPVLEQGSTTNGQLQLMRNATFDYDLISHASELTPRCCVRRLTGASRPRGTRPTS